MGKLLRVGNWYLEVRGRDHNPPHVHVIGPDFAAQVDIKTLAVIEGGMPRAIAKLALTWAEANRERLIAEWNRLNPDLPYRP